jgi:hypothetical protein
LSGTDIAPLGDRPFPRCPKQGDPQINRMHIERAIEIFTSESVGEEFLSTTVHVKITSSGQKIFEMPFWKLYVYFLIPEAEAVARGW